MYIKYKNNERTFKIRMNIENRKQKSYSENKIKRNYVEGKKNERIHETNRR